MEKSLLLRSQYFVIIQYVFLIVNIYLFDFHSKRTLKVKTVSRKRNKTNQQATI